jgi:glycosyltransferase involved in cell wall biosynthesis
MPGIDKYAFKLWEHLVADGGNDYVLFQERYRESGEFQKFPMEYFPALRELLGMSVTGAYRHDGEGRAASNGRLINHLKARSYYLRKDLIRAAYLSSRNLDLVHYPTQLERPYRFRNFRTVMTFHDAVPLIMPETLDDRIRAEMEEFLKRIHHVDCFIAVSQSTKDDMIRCLDIPDWKIHVVHNGYDKEYRLIPDSEWVRDKYTGGKSFVLFVGTLEPRKNVSALIKAFHRLNRKDLRLVLAGNRGWAMEKIDGLVETLKLGDRVIFPGYVPEEDLIALYNTAEAFVYPSYYEGFGIPLIEAMVCGAPVITSNTSSMPEVVGDAGLLIDPGDVEDLKSKIERVLSEPALRSRMKEAGLERAQAFSWEKSARETRAVYRRLAG